MGAERIVIENHHQDQGDVYEAAGFWLRFRAFALDGFVLTILYGVCGVGAAFGQKFGVDFGLATVILYPIMLYITYRYLLVPMKRDGQTWGKKYLGVRVISERGSEELSWGQVFLRELLGKGLSQSILMLGFLMAPFSEKRKTLHDHIASTRAIKE